MNVLLSNDDGIMAPGLRALHRALLAKGHEVFTVAPMRQQSGVSHSITVFEPLRCQIIEDEDFSGVGVHGTPADCVKLGLADLAPWVPDIVMAGINLGRNVGPDVFYSGTIGAASEGAHSGIPSLAFSYADAYAKAGALQEAAEHGVDLAEKIDWRKIERGRVINVNYPALPLAKCSGQRICPQSPAIWLNAYQKRSDPRGWPYWWMEGETDQSTIRRDTDMDLLERGYITITPLKFEHTDERGMKALEEMGI